MFILIIIVVAMIAIHFIFGVRWSKLIAGFFIGILALLGWSIKTSANNAADDADRRRRLSQLDDYQLRQFYYNENNDSRDRDMARIVLENRRKYGPL